MYSFTLNEQELLNEFGIGGVVVGTVAIGALLMALANAEKRKVNELHDAVANMYEDDYLTISLKTNDDFEPPTSFSELPTH